MSSPAKQDSRAQAIIGIVLLLICFAGLSWVLIALGKKLVTSDSKLIFGLLAVCLTGLLGIISSLVAKYQERQSIILEQHRQKKVELYEKIVKFIFRILQGDKLAEGAPKQEEIFQFLHDTSTTLILWGGDAVIKKFGSFVKKCIDGQQTPDPSGVMNEFGELLLEMRREIGHKNLGLDSNSILSLFVNNIK